jgi:hypothetical protein
MPLYGESGKAGEAILMVSFEKEVEAENMLMSKGIAISQRNRQRLA